MIISGLAPFPAINKLYDNPAFKLDNRVKIIYLTDVKPNKQELKNAIKNMKIFNIIKELFYSIKV